MSKQVRAAFGRAVSMRRFALTLGFAAMMACSPVAVSEMVAWVGAPGGAQWIDTDHPGEFAMTAKAGETIKAGTVTFNVVYNDVVYATTYGFDDRHTDAEYGTVGAARRAAVQRVLAYVGSIINESGTCDILFSNSLHGTSTGLSSAGPFFPQTTPLFTNGFAFQHIMTGVDPSGSVPDMSVTYYFDWPWYVGTGLPSSNLIDLDTVLLHDITRGLGLVSLSDANGASTARPNLMSVWDNLLETGSGQKLWDGTTAAFLGVPADLTGADGGVRFKGTFATQVYGSKPPVYAPSPFAAELSLGNWGISASTGIVPVMRPYTAPYNVSVNVVREYTLVDAAALKDLGYIHIKTPFVFTQAPSGGWFEVGQPLHMAVAVAGAVGNVTYQWQQNEADIPGATDAQYDVASVDYVDAGWYTCTVTDEAKSAHISPRTLVSVVPVGSLPTTGIVGLAIVAVACVLAGAFIIWRRE